MCSERNQDVGNLKARRSAMAVCDVWNTLAHALKRAVSHTPYGCDSVKTEPRPITLSQLARPVL
ncbi:hypothetical protein GQ44DRAFT_708530 [Phaeosphaeriaceae sp. PMI808]|nr:hypothetical protein GQ44DRAFT_708530 [Phaeosphaeriaceae sp. PMI808]